MSQVLFETKDPFGDLVQLTSNQWNQHILIGHDEVEPYLGKIQRCIESPDCILASRYEPDVKLFYKRGITQGKYQYLYLKVVVGYEKSPAFIKTAFFTQQLTGGKFLWIKTSL